MRSSSMGRRTALTCIAAVVAALPLGALAAEKGGAGGAVQTTKGDPNAPVFIKLDAINVTVFDRGVARGKLTLELRLDVLQKSRQAEVQARLPRLYDGFLAAVTEYSTRAADRPPDLDYLVERFQAIADQSLGPGVTKVLVHSAVRTL